MTADHPFGELFLSVPDLFPGRISGETWGDERLDLDIAGGPYRIEGLDATRREALERRFGPRVLSTNAVAEDLVNLKLLRAPAEDFREMEVFPWELTYDFDHGPSAIRIAGYRSFARIEWRPAMSTGLWLPPLESEPEFCAAVENLLRVAVAYRMVDLGGALFHSAGIFADGGAWMFVGQSGAGKSTLSRLSAARGFEVLSDELNALWMRDGEIRLERMPFAGELGQSAGSRGSYPLQGTFLLRQGPVPARESISRAEAAVQLAAAAPFLNIDPFRSDRLLDNVARLCSVVRVERLTFALDPGFWDILLPPP